MENKKTMKIEIMSHNSEKDLWFSSWLKLPAEEYEIEDAFQRTKIVNENDFREYVVYDCALMSSIEGKRLDSPSIYELDFLARRLEQLTEEELMVLKAIEPRYIEQEEDAIISIKDCINLTYGLDKVPIVSNVGNVTELGEFVMDNNLSPLEIDVPKVIYPYLDFAQIGRFVQDIEGGVFVGDKCFFAGSYEKQEVYDGKHLPNVDSHTNYVFGLEIAKSPNYDDDIENAIEKARWIYLPLEKKDANKVAKELGERKIEDCVYFDFKSIIPQIKSDNFGDMYDFDKLNHLAEMLLQMTPKDQAKFKAVLQAEEPQNIDGILDVAKNLKQYEFATQIESVDYFFKTYLYRHMEKSLDKTWIEPLYCQNEGKNLLERLGAKLTDYGVISARGDSLYKRVMCNNEDYPLMKERLELIEINGKKALFANHSISVDDIPQGLIKYDIREGDSLCFASIEKNVTVNHAGTIIVKEPFDFNGESYIILDDDKSLNFLGEEVSVEEFMETDYEQEEIQIQKMEDL